MMANLWLQLQDRVLTTAEILYYFPDYPDLLQQYIWQDYDVAPQFPCLNKFIQFWSHNLDGKLHSVRVTNAGVIVPSEIRLSIFETPH
jgi:uncharacterized protein Usg